MSLQSGELGAGTPYISLGVSYFRLGSQGSSLDLRRDIRDET